jgi:hypothetical protein
MLQWARHAFGIITRFLATPAMGFAVLSGPQSPEYSVDNAMSTLARFPWIWAAEEARSSDLAGLPLVAYRVDASGKRAKVPDRALALLDQPNAGTTGYVFRQQLYIDGDLTGNAYIWAPEGPNSAAIYRLHPRAVQPLPGPLGMPAGYDWLDAQTGETRRLPPEQVLHIRGPSWRDDAVAILGESRVRSLHDDLTTDVGARKTAALEAARGRPDILFSSKVPIGDEKAKEITGRWDEAGSKRRGAFFAGGEITATPLSWSPKDRGETERATYLRDTILAVMGVPLARLGIGGANYATDRQAIKTYWTALLGHARIYDDAFSALCAPGVRIGHDASRQEALQTSHTERQARMMNWILMGWSPEDAAAIEGFEGLPPRTGEPQLASVAKPKPGQGEDEQDEPNEPADKALAGRVRAALVLHYKAAEAVYAELADGVDTSLVARMQAERLVGGLELAGVDRKHARWWADELAGVLDEAHKMGLVDAFSEERALRTASHITARRAA